MLATIIGLRANATAMLVPNFESRRVFGGQQQRQKWVVTGFRSPAPVIPVSSSAQAASATRAS